MTSRKTYLTTLLQTFPMHHANKEIPLHHPVAQLTDGGRVMRTNRGFVITKFQEESYLINQKHRNVHVANSGLWTVTEIQEIESFCKCRHNGAFTLWKGSIHMGWGIVLDNHRQPIVLGQGVNKRKKMVDVKICKFVESNERKWHGYPIDYQHPQQNIICSDALHYWSHVLGIIDKSEINDIQNREESSLI